jgi:hypothetical protein
MRKASGEFHPHRRPPRGKASEQVSDRRLPSQGFRRSSRNDVSERGIRRRFQTGSLKRRLKRRFQTGGLRRKKASEKPQRGGSRKMALDKRFVTGGIGEEASKEGSLQQTSEMRVQRDGF